MKKLLIFVMALTFMAQATVSFAETIWDSEKLAKQFGVTSTNTFSSFNGIDGTGAHGISWATGGEIWTDTVTYEGHKVGSIGYMMPLKNDAPHKLTRLDYTINISFGANTGIADINATLRVDRIMNGDLSFFVINADDLTAFNKTFVVDGIEYETKLSTPQFRSLTAENRAWLEAELGVAPGTTIFGTYAGWGVQGHSYFHLDIGATGNNPVPVPAAVWLMGTGVAGLVALKRRNSAK